MNFYSVESMSLNIDMNVILPSNCSGIFCRVFRSFWICLRISVDVSPVKNILLELNLFSIDPRQFCVLVGLLEILNLFFPLGVCF